MSEATFQFIISFVCCLLLLLLRLLSSAMTSQNPVTAADDEEDPSSILRLLTHLTSRQQFESVQQLLCLMETSSFHEILPDCYAVVLKALLLLEAVQKETASGRTTGATATIINTDTTTKPTQPTWTMDVPTDYHKTHTDNSQLSAADFAIFLLGAYQKHERSVKASLLEMYDSDGRMAFHHLCANLHPSMDLLHVLVDAARHVADVDGTTIDMLRDLLRKQDFFLCQTPLHLLAKHHDCLSLHKKNNVDGTNKNIVKTTKVDESVFVTKFIDLCRNDPVVWSAMDAYGKTPFPADFWGSRHPEQEAADAMMVMAMTPTSQCAYLSTPDIIPTNTVVTNMDVHKKSEGNYTGPTARLSDEEDDGDETPMGSGHIDPLLGVTLQLRPITTPALASPSIDSARKRLFSDETTDNCHCIDVLSSSPSSGSHNNKGWNEQDVDDESSLTGSEHSFMSEDFSL